MSYVNVSAAADEDEHPIRGRPRLLLPIPPQLSTRAPRKANLSLGDALTEIRRKWGEHAVVRLADARTDRDRAATPPADRPMRLRAAPPWWPSELRGKPRVLELVAEQGTGSLSLMLAWIAEVKPVLWALVDPAHAFYPASAAMAGVDLARLILVRPPANLSKMALDACVLLVKSEAFDAVVCHLPDRARISSLLAGHLAAMAAKASTTLFVIEAPDVRKPQGLLGAAADYRVRLVGRRWRWQHGQITGVTLRVHTERARGADEGTVEHELRLGPTDAGGFGLTSTERIVRPLQPGTAIPMKAAPPAG